MYNIQLEHLNLSILKKKNPPFAYAAFEPLLIKKREFENLRCSDRIELGKELPEVVVYRDGHMAGRGELGTMDGADTIWLHESGTLAMERYLGKKRIAMEARLAAVPDEKIADGEMIRFGWQVHKNIVLFAHGSFFGMGELLQCKKGYLLKITEFAG
jgi:hypothetical protein